MFEKKETLKGLLPMKKFQITTSVIQSKFRKRKFLSENEKYSLNTKT